MNLTQTINLNAPSMRVWEGQCKIRIRVESKETRICDCKKVSVAASDILKII